MEMERPPTSAVRQVCASCANKGPLGLTHQLFLGYLATALSPGPHMPHVLLLHSRPRLALLAADQWVPDTQECCPIFPGKCPMTIPWD